MNATTPLWALAAILAATVLGVPGAAADLSLPVEACSPVQMVNGQPEYHPECLPQDELAGLADAAAELGLSD